MTFIPLLRDDNAAHQIRIEYGRCMKLVVSCTCLQRKNSGAYLSSIRNASQATDLWRQHWAHSLADVRELSPKLPRTS